MTNITVIICGDFFYLSPSITHYFFFWGGWGSSCRNAIFFSLLSKADNIKEKHFLNGNFFDGFQKCFIKCTQPFLLILDWSANKPFLLFAIVWYVPYFFWKKNPILVWHGLLMSLQCLNGREHAIIIISFC